MHIHCVLRKLSNVGSEARIPEIVHLSTERLEVGGGVKSSTRELQQQQPNKTPYLVCMCSGVRVEETTNANSNNRSGSSVSEAKQSFKIKVSVAYLFNKVPFRYSAYHKFAENVKFSTAIGSCSHSP
jgi:hypothetical protein